MIQRLDTLAEAINEQHRLCEAAAGKAVAHALEAGRMLEEAKAGVKHGEWGGWLEENFAGSARTARTYMQLNSRRDELTGQNGNSAADLSLRGALRQISAPEKSVEPYRTVGIPNGAGGWDEKHYYTIEEYAAEHGYRVSPPLLIDAEFDGLLPPLADDEYAGLERNILEWGCTDPIVAWNNTILDGHARYEICVKHSIDYLVRDKEMGSRDEAMVWIIDQQLGRKNLSHHKKIYIRAKAEVDSLVRERGISEEKAWEELLGSED
jgi:hypothetical protein